MIKNVLRHTYIVKDTGGVVHKPVIDLFDTKIISIDIRIQYSEVYDIT